MIKAASHEAVDLFHRGAIALSRVEHVGIRIDERKLKSNINQAQDDILRLEAELRKDPLWSRWRRRHGERTKIGSREQLATLLFDELGYECKTRTESGRYKVDEVTLQEIPLPFVQSYIQWQKLIKAKTTFLEGIQKEVSDGYLHAIYNLNIARTYRSSSDSPNFQNFPVRDKVLGKLIRSVFIPRRRHVLLEIDFKGIEVRVSACYNKDPNLIQYILDPTKDMHRDMASQCYMTPSKLVSKDMRYCAKNQYVFPQFYGDWYLTCARAMWDSIQKLSLKTEDGVPVGEMLKRKGIKGLGKCDPKSPPVPGTFEHHIQMVEKDFWGRRFKVYQQWKEKWWELYQKRGWFQMYTGFVESGVMGRNDVINHPVQGAAFHCELWSLIELQDWLIKNKMRSVIVGTIHDSTLIDAHEDEVEDVYAKAEEIMTKRLLEHYKWIIVPIEIETDIAETNWAEKHPYTVAL